MKKWTWQFKTSLSSNKFPLIPVKFTLPWLIAGASVILVAFVSCRIHQQEASEPDNVAVQGKKSSISTFASSFFAASEPEYIRILSGKDHGSGLVVELNPDSCDQLGKTPSTTATTATPEIWKYRIHVTSLFGNESILIDISSDTSTNAKAVISNQKVEFRNSRIVDREWMKKACALAGKSDESRQIVAEPSIADAASEWISQVAPDCEQKEIDATGWRCDLPVVEPGLAAKEIEHLKSVMITSWSRQPYIMARRAAVSLTLSKALLKPTAEIDKNLDQFCKVVAHSAVAELPLVMNSKIWRKAVCETKASSRIEAATIGLTKAMNELELLRRLFESSSKLGVLTVRIPRADVPAGNLIVSLTPDADVAANLAKETSNIWLQRGATTTQPPRACWHPIFSDSPDMLNLAQQLDLAGDAPKSSCGTATINTADNQSTIAKYLADSVTSDTEFLLINGQAKMLRLPTGSYSYTIHSAPDHVAEFNLANAQAEEIDSTGDDEGEESDEEDSNSEEQHATIHAAKSSGKIIWESRRPRPLIRTW